MKVSLNAGIEEYTGDKNLQDQSEFNALVHDVESELEKKNSGHDQGHAKHSG